MVRKRSLVRFQLWAPKIVMNKLFKESSLKNFIIIFASTLFVGYFFSQVHFFEQRAVDAGLVLAKMVNYPDQISPMKEYFIKSWTSLHQISKLLLNFNWSFAKISKLIIFITAILYFIGIVLTMNSSTRSISISILVALLILVFQKNLGDTDYPSLVFSEHTYGMISLAMVTCIFGLLLSGNLFSAGFFSSLLISIHLIIGIWISGIIFISLIINKYSFKIIQNNKNLIKGFITGIIFTIISLIYHFVLSADFNSYFDLEAYNNYMKYWEGHRNETKFHLEYFSKTMILFFFGFLSLIVFNNNFTNNFKFGILCVLVSIVLSSIFYFAYKFFQPYIPDFFVRVMPARFTIMHSIIGWPIILGTLFVFIKKFEGRHYIPNNFGYFLIIFIVLFYSVSHHKVFVKLQSLFINNASNQIILTEEKRFWDVAKKAEFDGYIITSFSSSTISMRKTLKPIILDVSSFDFVPYFPNTAKSMSMIIEQIYGIPFNNPPSNVKNRPFLSDESIKYNFENYSKKKWKELSKNFNFQGIIVPVNWKINLIPNAKNQRFAFYII